MKKPISIKLDEELWVHIKNKPNKSRYISELIKQDIQLLHTRPIVQAVSSELLQNEGFFREIQSRVRSDSGVPSTPDNPFQLTATPIGEPPKPFIPKPPDPILGYPCCQKEKPCKHWAWQPSGDGYVNTLTGQIKEVL